MKRAVIFDLDGTLLDTFPGIMESANDAASSLGYGRVDERDRFFPFTGLPLQVGFPTVYGTSPEDSLKCPGLFMEEYGRKGCLIYRYYEGVLETVSRLHDEGILMGVSTLKTESAAVKMIDSSAYRGMFSSVRGNTPSDDAVKSRLIGQVMEDLGVKPEETVFVGDTVGDMLGARDAGTSFIGVSWGFGSEGLMKETRCAESAGELFLMIREMSS